VINIILKKDYNGWETGQPLRLLHERRPLCGALGYLVGGVSNDKTSHHGIRGLRPAARACSSGPFLHEPDLRHLHVPGFARGLRQLSGSDNFYQLAPGLNAPPRRRIHDPAAGEQRDLCPAHVHPGSSRHFNLANGETLIGSLKRYSAW
jgi:hypothetical protein